MRRRVVGGLASSLALALAIALGLISSSSCGGGGGGGGGDRPVEDPAWPPVFHAKLAASRVLEGGEKDLGITELWYDSPGGRNLNVIRWQSEEWQGPLWSNERANGTTYYYYPQGQTCSSIDFGVPTLPATWLENATFIGRETVGTYETYVWQKGESEIPGVPFITYYEEARESVPRRPVRWIFSSGSVFDVITYTVGEALPELNWQLPEYCFGVSPER